MAGLARFVLRHRKLVVLFWVAIFIIGGATSQKTTDRLTFDFSLPGQPGYETSKKVLATYGTDALDAPTMLVLYAPQGEFVDDVVARDTFAAVQAKFPQARVIDKTAAGGDPVFSTSNGQAQFAYVYTPQQTNFEAPIRTEIRDALKAVTPQGLSSTTTGYFELATSSGGDEGPSVLAETLLAGTGALAVLAFVFASFLALIPLFIAAVSIMTTFLILLGITYVADVSFIVQFLVSLVGLGVAIDYSLLFVTRWREEKDHGKENHDAIVATMETAGHAVLFSGATVAVGLFALVLLPVPFLQSIGYGGMLIPLASVAVTLTMLPAILGGIGPKVDWPKIRHENKASRFWTAWGRGVVRHRVLAVLAAVVMLGALIVPFFDIKIGTGNSDSLAKSGEAYDALHLMLDNGLPLGALTPMEILSSTDSATDVAAKAASVPDIATAFVETGPNGTRGDTTLAIAIPRDETVDATSIGVVEDVKDAVEPIPGVVGVAGIGALQHDYVAGVFAKTPLAIGLIVLITYVLLVRAFRSLLLPLKAVILNLISLAATFGAMVLFWQMGYGSEAIYDIAATGAITFWMPLMIFAFLYGLSMDYEVFILARMREEYDETHNTNEAVIVGTGRTGRLVTSAALILFLAFLSLASGPGTDIKLFATGLAIGILLDATVIRMLLVPALVSLFGAWNWYLPDWVAKLLRVKPSSYVPEDRTIDLDDNREPVRVDA